MHIIVSGSSGLIGSALVPHLRATNHKVSTLVRVAASSSEEICWDPNTRVQFPVLTGVDAVVHLAGESIAQGRWTKEKKQRIRDSRMRGTTTLCEGLLSLTPRPKVLVCASAIGIYGSRGDEELDEASAPGTGFLADVASEWEQATEIAKAAGIRVVNLRLGVVLSPKGGALQKMLLPFSLGLGGTLGRGNQWMSWISLVDVLGLIDHALQVESLSGPLNAVAPHPVTNRDFTRTLGQVLCRPTPFPIPVTLLRLIFGEFADEALLSSTRALPRKALTSGYSFTGETLEEALRLLLGRPLPKSQKVGG